MANIYDLFDELLDEGMSTDEIITALRKYETQKKDDELKAKKKEELAEARTKAITGLVEYMAVLDPSMDAEKVAADYTKSFIAIEKQLDELNALEQKLSKSLNQYTGKVTPKTSDDDTVLKDWLKKLF